MPEQTTSSLTASPHSGSGLQKLTTVGTPLGVTDAESGNLVPGAREHFASAVREYGAMLFSEAKGIEEMEHEGAGPPEITAAHVEEAKWVLVRRYRRRSRRSKLTVLCRFGQLAASVLAGVGASSIKEVWGSVMCLVGVATGFIFFVAEREIGRD